MQQYNGNAYVQEYGTTEIRQESKGQWKKAND